MLFHTPYVKLVRKAFSTVVRSLEATGESLPAGTSEDEVYRRMVQPGTVLPATLGNSYCASLYCSLVSLLLVEKDAAAAMVCCVL